MRFLFLLVFVVISNIVYSQGCSDAGFCTISNLKPGHFRQNEYSNHVKSGVSFGKADFDISVVSAILEYRRKITHALSLDMRLTGISQNGNDIASSGLSDLYLNAGYSLNESFALTAGLKLPFNSGNKTNNGLALPMDYQSSLGTTDVIIGAGVNAGAFQINLAFQQPVSQNENQFNSQEYPAGSPVRNFPTTNNFKRSGDVMLRVSYPVVSGTKWKITPAILPIYHLANDKYTDVDGVEKEITGSQGLTLNANVFADYQISDSFSAQMVVGLPLVVREARPDGLTRSFVAGIELMYNF